MPFQKGHKFFGDLSKPNYFKKGQRRSPKTEFKKGHKGDRNEAHPQWKGDKVGYAGIHTWLRINFGYPKKCEHCKIETANRYEWALLKGKQYQRKRENFIILCVSCHKKYDYSDKRKRNLSKALKLTWKKRKNEM